MFDGFEKVSEASKKTGEQKPAGSADPEMDEKEMKQFEQQFMGMFQNLAKQIDEMEDDEDDEEEDMPDDE